MPRRSRKPHPDEIEALLQNARLRDELEPFVDESLTAISEKLPTQRENEYLSAILAWERAPALPIARWFEPPLSIPHPDALVGDELRRVLWDTIHKLFEKRIVLDFTDHLSDRQLYSLIYRDILPAFEKKIDAAQNYLHWDCAADEEAWLKHYADDEDRDWWRRQTGKEPPPHEPPPYPRKLPKKPM
jgi:hypothetical protein